jgi:hypothetical protein
MPLDDFKIDTRTIRTDFRKHLLQDGNDRIIFSAPFGTGKTTFLQDLDSEKDLAIIHLAPVNYSVSPNEDIFRLIKYDIINELLVTHEVPPEAPQMSRMAAYGATLPAAAPGLFRSLLGGFSALNKDLPDPEKLFEVKDKLEQYVGQTEQLRRDPELNQRAIDFMIDSEKLLPVLENDFITGFIQQGLDKLAQPLVAEEPENADSKQSATLRTTVLVIDDLDRLDPEHTFRLFNIFSAHLDHHAATTNKFGFDKIVFVCDIDNIRNLFHSRYGADTDFSGYIDKFYSNEVFHFDIGPLVSNEIINILSSITFSENSEELRSRVIGNRGDSSFSSIILTEMASIRAITLRRLISRAGHLFPLKQRRLNFNRYSYDDYNTKFIGVLILEFLTWVAGSTHALESALLKVRRWARSEHYSSKRYNERQLAGIFLAVAAIPVHNFVASNVIEQRKPDKTGSAYTYSLSNGTAIGFWLQNSDRGYYEHFEAHIDFINGSEPKNDQTYPAFDLLYEAFIVLKNSGYLR